MRPRWSEKSFSFNAMPRPSLTGRFGERGGAAVCEVEDPVRAESGHALVLGRAAALARNVTARWLFTRTHLRASISCLGRAASPRAPRQHF